MWDNFQKRLVDKPSRCIPGGQHWGGPRQVLEKLASQGGIPESACSPRASRKRTLLQAADLASLEAGTDQSLEDRLVTALLESWLPETVWTVG